MSLSSVLPKPKHSSLSQSKWANDAEPTKKKSKVPKYMHRQGFLPQLPKDFGDGGAFPEIDILQYPLDMGRKKPFGAEIADKIPLQTDEHGNVRYDLVLRQGEGQVSSKKHVFASLQDLKEQDNTIEVRPDEETVEEVTAKTREALEKLSQAKDSFGKPKGLGKQSTDPSYIKYVPSQPNKTTDAVANSRIIRLSEAPVDPLDPPRFKHRKIPRSTGSPPPPVLRSPPRKVSAEEQANWVIPPCISNWKNAKGYTIPLDKRLANDGRGLQDVTINDNFAKLSEALFIADRHAREEVKLRAEMQQNLILKQKKEKEEKLRQLAQQAREERINLSKRDQSGSESSEEELDDEDLKNLKEREELRKSRQRERQQEYRKEHTRSKPVERDISEKIALGVAKPNISQDGLYDQRLFNQSAGLTSGYQGSDSYSIYDKPLFNQGSSTSIYRPQKTEKSTIGGIDSEKLSDLMNKGPNKGFSGTDASENIRSGPVRFEKEDVFGMDEFMSTVKRGRDDDDDRETKKR